MIELDIPSTRALRGGWAARDVDAGAEAARRVRSAPLERSARTVPVAANPEEERRAFPATAERATPANEPVNLDAVRARWQRLVALLDAEWGPPNPTACEAFERRSPRPTSSASSTRSATERVTRRPRHETSGLETGVSRIDDTCPGAATLRPAPDRAARADRPRGTRPS